MDADMILHHYLTFTHIPPLIEIIQVKHITGTNSVIFGVATTLRSSYISFPKNISIRTNEFFKKCFDFLCKVKWVV